MKTKEELIKIYSSYLPYQLNIAVMGEFMDEERKIPQIFQMVGLDTNYVEYHELGRTVTEQTEFSDVFPHLWSMDMLTKEIEHKGEKVKFTDYFRKKYEPTINVDFAIQMWEYDFVNVIMYDDYLLLPHYYIQELLSFHFNVFRLDESEYIKKENL